MGLFSSAKNFLKKNLSVIQTGLDVLGLIPGVGAVADVLNASIYAVQGDYKNAALSALSAVPGIGDGAGALKLSAKAAKVAKDATKAAKVAERSIYLNDMREDLKNGDFVSLGMRILGPAATRGIVKVGAKAVKKTGNKVSGKFAGSEIGNKFAKFKKWCKCNRFWGSCFTEETLVLTENGYIPIKEVSVGSLVYSMNEETGEIALKEVEKVSRSSTHVIYSIQLNGDVEINTTAYHQFYLDGEGWVSVIHLKIADRLLTKDGIALVTNIKKIRHEEAVPVFNFSIKDWVSYFVSKAQVYVHNDECPKMKRDLRTKIAPTGKVGGKPKGSYADNSTRGLIRQNETADLLANKGYNVTMLDEVPGGNGYGLKQTSNPDFIIENKVFDSYTPDTNTSVNTIIKEISQKTKNQAPNITLNLDDYAGNVDELIEVIKRKANLEGDLKRLQDLIVIKKGNINFLD